MFVLLASALGRPHVSLAQEGCHVPSGGNAYVGRAVFVALVTCDLDINESLPRAPSGVFRQTCVRGQAGAMPWPEAPPISRGAPFSRLGHPVPWGPRGRRAISSISWAEFLLSFNLHVACCPHHRASPPDAPRPRPVPSPIPASVTRSCTFLSGKHTGDGRPGLGGSTRATQ